MVKERMDLLELLRKGGMDGDVDFLREALRVVVEGIMDAEVSSRIGAEYGERSPERVTQRNGYRSRAWDTRVGTMDLHIPKLREGSYFPSLLEPRRRSERALLAVIQQAYVGGVSTRRVDDLVKALGCEGISKSQVSRICQELDVVVDGFMGRPLGAGTTHGAGRQRLLRPHWEMDVRFSITIRQRASLPDLIEAIPEEDWIPIPYWMDGAADVAETTYTPFQTKPDAAPVRLIVRRVKPTPGSHLALFARYSYHAFITDRDGEALELEADRRRHAEVENAIRDLKYGVGLNHMPSARFAANGAWLAGQVMRHHLARWTARIGLGERTVITKTLRRRVLALVGASRVEGTCSLSSVRRFYPLRRCGRASRKARRGYRAGSQVGGRGPIHRLHQGRGREHQGEAPEGAGAASEIR